MTADTTQELNSLPTEELEAIVHRGENLQISTSRASQAQRILESRRHAELIAAAENSKHQEESLSPTDLTIFYSWQSDLPNKTNRGLIEEALEMAVKNIEKDSSIKIIPRLDKDTAGVPGSPNIATTILDKIDHSFLVVSDVSIINSNDKSKQTPNPNVLYELGYAVKSLGMSNVMMVLNTAYGDPQKLPFDLKLHRVLTYECNPKGNASEIRKVLANKMESAIRLSLQNTPISQLKKNDDSGQYEDDIKSAINFFDTSLKSDTGYWELVVFPTTYKPELIQTPVEAGNVIEELAIHLRGWDFPHVDRHGNATNFNKGKQSFTVSEDIEVQEAWRMYKNGLFAWKSHFREDLMGYHQDGKKVLFFVSAIYSLTEIVLFLQKLYVEKLNVGSIHIELTLNGCKGRVLGEGQPGLLHRGYVCNEDQIIITKDIKAIDLKNSFESIARLFVKDIFMLFNWNDPLESMLEDWQKKLLEHKA